MDDKSLAPRISECVGLWLAEGSTNSKSEITFTNTCWDLIDLFYKTITQLFPNLNPRIYVYSKDGEKVKIPYKNCVVKYYIHKRATKPFFILRFASVEKIREWNKTVKDSLSSSDNYRFILRGFFAGEGNVYMGSHKSRRLRIAQKIQKEFIDNLLHHFNLKFSFTPKNRSYNITGKTHWDIFAKFNLADLHPNKKEKFWELYNSYQEEHYPANYLIKEIFSALNNPLITKDLARIFKRSSARIQDALSLLKKQGRAFNYRVKNIDHWTNNPNLLIISKLKNDYLLFLDVEKETSQFAKHFNVCWKSSFNRLKELEKLNLVRRKNNVKWIRLKIEKNKKILVI